jgi:hypothetical protein
MERSFCIEAVGEPRACYGRPAIVNRDRGRWFMATAFTAALKNV